MFLHYFLTLRYSIQHLNLESVWIALSIKNHRSELKSGKELPERACKEAKIKVQVPEKSLKRAQPRCQNTTSAPQLPIPRQQEAQPNGDERSQKALSNTHAHTRTRTHTDTHGHTHTHTHPKQRPNAKRRSKPPKQAPRNHSKEPTYCKVRSKTCRDEG